MKIAVATEQGRVAQHFGHCEGFTLFETHDGRIESQCFVPSPGHQPGALPVFLKERGVEAVIAGGMGARAQALFDGQGIGVIVGASGDCAQAAAGCLSGSLTSTQAVCHEHAHAHECGGH